MTAEREGRTGCGEGLDKVEKDTEAALASRSSAFVIVVI